MYGWQVFLTCYMHPFTGFVVRGILTSDDGLGSRELGGDVGGEETVLWRGETSGARFRLLSLPPELLLLECSVSTDKPRPSMSMPPWDDAL